MVYYSIDETEVNIDRFMHESYFTHVLLTKTSEKKRN
jgi:hypothetical protein